MEIPDHLKTEFIQAANDSGRRVALNLLADQWYRLSPIARTKDLVTLKLALIDALLFIPNDLLPAEELNTSLSYTTASMDPHLTRHREQMRFNMHEMIRSIHDNQASADFIQQAYKKLAMSMGSAYSNNNSLALGYQKANKLLIQLGFESKHDFANWIHSRHRQVRILGHIEVLRVVRSRSDQQPQNYMDLFLDYSGALYPYIPVRKEWIIFTPVSTFITVIRGSTYPEITYEDLSCHTITFK